MNSQSKNAFINALNATPAEMSSFLAGAVMVVFILLGLLCITRSVREYASGQSGFQEVINTAAIYAVLVMTIGWIVS